MFLIITKACQNHLNKNPSWDSRRENKRETGPDCTNLERLATVLNYCCLSTQEGDFVAAGWGKQAIA